MVVVVMFSIWAWKPKFDKPPNPAVFISWCSPIQVARFEIFHRFSSLINLRHQLNLHSAKGMILRLSLHFSQLFRDSESDHGRPLEFFLLSWPRSTLDHNKDFQTLPTVLDDWWFCESQDMTKSIWCTELPRPILRNIAKNRLNRCVPGPARAMQWAFQL